MRVKTSVTLPSALLKEIDRLDGNRSAFLERAALAYIGKRVKSDLDARDAAILDCVAGELNEQSDVLEFQGLPKQAQRGDESGPMVGSIRSTSNF